MGIFIFFCLGGTSVLGQIAAWDFSGQNNVATVSATTFNANLVAEGKGNITRGTGAKESPAANSFRTQGFGNDGIAVTNNDYFQITLSASTGYKISLSSIDAIFGGTNTYYASPGVTSQFAYSLDGTNFSLIGSPVTSSLLMMAQIDLTGIPALQDVPSSVTITIRYYASGQTTTGGWGFHSPSSGQNGLAIGGTVNPEVAVSDYFRSKTNGDWSVASTWESSVDNISWQNATSWPTSSASGITIRNEHNIAVTRDASARLLTIENGGTLEIQNATKGNALTVIRNGTTIPDLSIYGTMRLYGKSPVLSNGATAMVFNQGKVQVVENDVGEGDDFASSSKITFLSGAVFDWSSSKPFQTNGITYFANSGPSEIPVFRISKSLIAVSNSPIAFNGILEVNSNLVFIGNGAKNFRNGISGIGTLTLDASSGTTTINGPNAILSGTVTLVIDKPLNLWNGLTVPVGANVLIKGTKDIAKNSGSLLINGTLDVTDRSISNTSGDVTVNGTLKTGNANGLYATGATISAPSSLKPVLNPGSTIEYNAQIPQQVNNLPYYNLTLSGSGVKTPTSSFAPNGTITIKDNTIFNCTSMSSSINIGDETTSLTMRDDARLIVYSTSTNPAIKGTYNLSGNSIIEFRGSHSDPQTIRNEVYQNIEVTGTNVGNSEGHIQLKANGSFTVKSGGSFSINTNSVKAVDNTDGQKLIVESGGVFKCGNNQGFNGFTPTTGNYSSIHSNITDITLQPGSTVEYMRSGDQPITNANGLVYSNLVLSGTGNKTAPPGVLTLKGDLSKTSNAVFVPNNGTVEFNGASVQNYNSVSPQMMFYNLTNNNFSGLNIKDSLSVYNQLTLGDKSIINLDRDITLMSNSGNTANIAPVQASVAINYNSGRFIVERYIPLHQKAWQFVAAPIKGSSVNAAWQEGNSPEANSNPGYGVQITSPYGTAAGFDLVSPGHSMKYWNPATNDWAGITSTFNEISNLNGYMLFVRGDRSVNGTKITTPTATTLRSRGKLYAPGIEAPSGISVPANSFQSIGNPYASAIGFEKVFVKSTGIDGSYYIWDPQLTSSEFSAYGYGAYRTISYGVAVPGGGNYPDSNPPPIQSGQAFFVRGGVSGGVVNFDESVKVTGSRNVFKPALSTPAAQLRVNLYVMASEPVLVDGILTQFDESFANELDAFDAIKIANTGENMSILSHRTKLAIERRKMPTNKDTLFYHLGQLQRREYQLEFIGSHLERNGMGVFLEDNYQQTKVPLSLSDTTLINFSVDGNPASFAPDRFHIVFTAPAGPLPVSFVYVKATPQNSGINIEWKVENESNLLHYVVEKSLDSKEFDAIGTIAAKNIASVVYLWQDANPFDGHNYYRVKSVGINGDAKYSPIVQANTGMATPSFFVYPNPLVGDVIHLKWTSQHAGSYKIRLLDPLGKLIFYKTIKHLGGNGSETIQLRKYAALGAYLLEVTGANGKKAVLRITK